ncbi:uncharacterized protein LOC120559157 isoform X1 [Perca fluviatilis]|uniref:uncharacterized protein LOC120559157 isoform X1 n=1 Tax=Perca fluviatilis TaxID=8168 RepID=UPI001965C9F8|nr:uncharacterized protein LOC120559157 isoform X1 [Perca fluviatilis]
MNTETVHRTHQRKVPGSIKSSPILVESVQGEFWTLCSKVNTCWSAACIPIFQRCYWTETSQSGITAWSKSRTKYVTAPGSSLRTSAPSLSPGHFAACTVSSPCVEHLKGQHVPIPVIPSHRSPRHHVSEGRYHQRANTWPPCPRGLLPLLKPLLTKLLSGRLCSTLAPLPTRLFFSKICRENLDYWSIIELCPADFNFISTPRLSGRDGGLAVIFRNSVDIGLPLKVQPHVHVVRGGNSCKYRIAGTGEVWREAIEATRAVTVAMKACLDPPGNTLPNGAPVKLGGPITRLVDKHDYRNIHG